MADRVPVPVQATPVSAPVAAPIAKTESGSGSLMKYYSPASTLQDNITGGTGGRGGGSGNGNGNGNGNAAAVAPGPALHAMSCPPQSGDDRAALSLAPLFPQPGSPGVMSKPVAHIPGCLLALESLFMHYCLPSRLLLTGGEGLHLGDTGVELVARSLMGTFRVVEVDLSRNEIGPAGATAFSTSLGMPGTEPEPHRGRRLRCRGGTQPDRERVNGNTYCKHLKRQHLNICIARTPTAPDEYFCSVRWVALKTPGLFVFFGPTNARERRRGFFACFVEVRRCLSRAKQVLSRRSRTGCGPGA